MLILLCCFACCCFLVSTSLVGTYLTACQDWFVNSLGSAACDWIQQANQAASSAPGSTTTPAPGSTTTSAPGQASKTGGGGGTKSGGNKGCRRTSTNGTGPWRQFDGWDATTCKDLCMFGADGKVHKSDGKSWNPKGRVYSAYDDVAKNCTEYIPPHQVLLKLNGTKEGRGAFAWLLDGHHFNISKLGHTSKWAGKKRCADNESQIAGNKCTGNKPMMKVPANAKVGTLVLSDDKIRWMFLPE